MLVKVKVYDQHFHEGAVTINLTLRQWLTLKLCGRVYVFSARKKGYAAMTPFYVVKCKTHGYFLEYPQGVYLPTFYCPLCSSE
ncbi:MAG: hypothetical protein OEY30_04325 [Candidatus Bathyarchaeota archaeon]|nr:hypothetical protein [Candidatus Bathyarchaeota archaeon]